MMLLLTLLLAAAPVTSPPPPAPAIPVSKLDPGAIAAAGRVLDAMGYEAMMDSMTEKFSAQFGPEMTRSLEERTGAPANPQLIEKLAAAQGRFLRDFATDPKLRAATELLYARHFSVDELDRMAVLLADPVMQKWNKRTPAVMADFLPLVMRQLATRRPDLEAEIGAIIADYGIDLNQDETSQ